MTPESTIRAAERDRCRRLAHHDKVCGVCGWEDASALQKRERRTNAANDLLRRKSKILRVAFPPRDGGSWVAAVRRYRDSLPPKPPVSYDEAEAQVIDALTSDESEAYGGLKGGMVTLSREDAEFLLDLAEGGVNGVMRTKPSEVQARAQVIRRGMGLVE